jgi:hypothetical protein
MSQEAPRAPRRTLRCATIVCVAVSFAPRLLAQSEQPGDSTGVTETGGPAFHLFSAGDVDEVLDASGQSKDEPATPPPKPPPSLQDLGFAPDLARGDAEAQARLDKRTHMLKVHQTLGLVTLAPLIATVFAAGGAGKHGSNSGRNLHGALGVVTAGLYITTASYAIRAPSIPGMEVRGPIRVHKALGWVHGVGMILTPILGAMARSQLNSGEKVHGIAAAHGAVADITVAAYAAAIGSVAIKW